MGSTLGNCVSLNVLSQRIATCFWRPGMNTLLTIADERVADVEIDDDGPEGARVDGRAISTPPAWFPRLLHGAPGQRRNLVIAGAGVGIHLEEVDEGLITDGLLRGAPAIKIPMAIKP